MRILLDTHAFLWFASDDPKLPNSAKIFIENVNNERLISMASIWELALKVSIGKLKIKKLFPDLIPNQLKINDIDLLPIELSHLNKIVNLPFYHRDPFDRLIIAQSLIEQIPIISKEKLFDKYGINKLWN